MVSADDLTMQVWRQWFLRLRAARALDEERTLAAQAVAARVRETVTAHELEKYLDQRRSRG